MEQELSQSISNSLSMYKSPREIEKMKVLRSKVIKLLDDKFSKMTTRMRALDARSRQVKENYIAVREREYMEIYNSNDPNKRAPQYLDFQFYQPTIKTIKNPFLVPQHIPMTTVKEEPSIEKLCKFLNYDEIEMDPIYFLGVKDYQEDDVLTNRDEWARQLEKVKELRHKEKHFKEFTMMSKSDFAKTKLESISKKMYECTLGHSRPKDYETKAQSRTLTINTLSRRVKARNFTMSTLTKMKRDEVDEQKRQKVQGWVDGYDVRLSKVQTNLQSKKELQDRAIHDSQQARSEAQLKVQDKLKKVEDMENFRKTYFKINQAIKDRVSAELKIKARMDIIARARSVQNLSKKNLEGSREITAFD